MRLREGDKVKVITGKDAGKESRVVRVMPKTGKLIVEGVNTAKKHQAPRGQTMQGGIIDKDMPINSSNVMIICSDCGPTRVGHRVDADGVKHRTCVKCGGDL
ncbi:MAG: 50S ribosomal protein L24 [Acidimicrobiia bacterium]|nr:50S ribosomal protein L24 [Acidimicrobiia bacterium]MDH3397265.1 50S ribosomal protein L24 [Acidimicrobiia bacterium]MDH5616696.1 50S ribosomal protein L24 [Acidimicrobiia bacterium]